MRVPCGGVYRTWLHQSQWKLHDTIHIKLICCLLFHHYQIIDGRIWNEYEMNIHEYYIKQMFIKYAFSKWSWILLNLTFININKKERSWMFITCPYSRTNIDWMFVNMNFVLWTVNVQWTSKQTFTKCLMNVCLFGGSGMETAQFNVAKSRKWTVNPKWELNSARTC